MSTLLRRISVSLTGSSVLDLGRVRTNQEDAVLVDLRRQVIAVCDGMGGCDHGEAASGSLVKLIQASALPKGPLWRLRRALRKTPPGAIQGKVEQWVQSLGTRLKSELDTTYGFNRKYYGTTLALATIIYLEAKPHWLVIWVGDSRAYLKRRGKAAAIPLSRDHSLVQALIDSGCVNQTAACISAHRSVLWAGLPNYEDGEPVGFRMAEVWDGDKLLLTSDGLTDDLMHPTLRWKREDYYTRSSIGKLMAGNNTAAAIFAAHQKRIRARRFVLCSGQDNYGLVLVTASVSPGRSK